MIQSILPTNRDRWLAMAFVALWAFLFLPNVRTNPNWYGDEGDWMEKSWTFIHGTPRVGPVINDFVFPFPYPPLYMLINGMLLRVFGDDIGVSRALGAVTALGAAVILFWIGTRLRDRKFGFLCAAAFLVYGEANANFRWVRSHPMAGTLALASVGFLIRYVQEKRLRDIVWAGVMCSLATATNYFTYPLIGAVMITAAVVNPVATKTPFLQTLKRRAMRAGIAAAAAGAYGTLFVAWYSATRGWGHLMTQVHLLKAVAGNEIQPTALGELERFAQNVWNLGFHTPTQGPPLPWSGHDWWLTVATVGFLFLPARNWRLRLWVPFWLLVLMYGVFKKLNNVPMFFYPATIFLPLMAVGFAGVLAWIEELAKRIASWSGDTLATAVAILVLGGFGLQSAAGAWGHFHTRIDLWTQQSQPEAEAAMGFVNSHTTKDDFILAPKQVYWLAQSERRSLLTFCARYEGIANDMPTAVLESHDAYWFDCRWQNAKYLVMASGVDTRGGRNLPMGIDLVYSSGLAGVPERVEALLNAGWQPVYVGGSGKMAIVDTRGHKWPVVVNGEYLVLANPRLAIAGQK
jgi:hypothetical protein